MHCSAARRTAQYIFHINQKTYTVSSYLFVIVKTDSQIETNNAQLLSDELPEKQDLWSGLADHNQQTQ